MGSAQSRVAGPAAESDGLLAGCAPPSGAAASAPTPAAPPAAPPAPPYIPPVLRKVDDYIEPRVGPEYQVGVLPECAPSRAGRAEAHSLASNGILLYSRTYGRQAEEKLGWGPQHDVLLDEVSARHSARVRASRGRASGPRPSAVSPPRAAARRTRPCARRRTGAAGYCAGYLAALLGGVWASRGRHRRGICRRRGGRTCDRPRSSADAPAPCDTTAHA